MDSINQTIAVESQAVSRFRFTDRGLTVGFTSGAVYVYPDISAEEAAVLAIVASAKREAPDAISFGGYFHKVIRPRRAERIL